MKKIILFSLLTFLSIFFTQIEALLAEESTEKKKPSSYLLNSRSTENVDTEESYHLFRMHRSQYYPKRSLHTATLLSATMPGLGQAYADNYFKATLFLASEISIFSYASYHIARSLHYRNHNKFNTGFYDERIGDFLTEDQVKVRSRDHAIQGSLFMIVGLGIHVWNIMDASKTAEEYNNRRISVQMQQTKDGTQALVFTHRY